jgi:hypothetical protein
MTTMLPERALQIAEDQRRRFNERVDLFDTPQPTEVMARLAEIVAAASLLPGEVVLDVGTGVGVLIPLIENYRPAAILACDLAEKMLERYEIVPLRVLPQAFWSRSTLILERGGPYTNWPGSNPPRSSSLVTM